MTETATPEALVASLTAALDEEEAAANAAKRNGYPAGRVYHSGAPALNGWWAKNADEAVRPITLSEGRHAARNDPARTLRRVAAHREILDRYAETLRDYAWSLKQARGGPVANADLDAFEAELPVLRSIVEIIAGIYEEKGG